MFTGAITGVTNGDNITASYSCSATANSPVGTYPIVPGLVDPDDRQTNYTVTLVNGTLTITGTPVLAWTNPAPITYGAPLTSNQLNATTSVPGSFAYNPTNGTVLNAGTNTLSVIFTPADTVDYSSVTDSVSLVVSPAPLTVTASNVSQPYGHFDPVFTGTITGVTNGDNITASYSCIATANSPVGTYPIVAGLVDPDDRQTNYTVTLVNGTLTITGTPILTWTPVPIPYGAALGSNQLNATTSVPGSFAYSPTNGTVLNAGTNTLSVIFTPADTVDYGSVSDSVSLVVSPAPLTVTACRCHAVCRPDQSGAHGPHHWRDERGQHHGQLQLQRDNQQPAGNLCHRAGLGGPGRPPDQLHGHTDQRHVDHRHGRPGPGLDESDLHHLWSLSDFQPVERDDKCARQLRLRPDERHCLGRGDQRAVASSSRPADAVDYSSVTDSVSLVVSPAPLTVTASNASQPYGQSDPEFTGAISGVTNGDNITALYSCGAAASSPVGTYPIVPALVDPDNRQTNYAVTLVNGTLTITMSVPVLAWTNPAPITYGAASDFQPVERHGQRARQLRLQSDQWHSLGCGHQRAFASSSRRPTRLITAA